MLCGGLWVHVWVLEQICQIQHHGGCGGVMGIDWQTFGCEGDRQELKEQTKSNQWPSWVHPIAYIPWQTLNFLKILFLYLSDWAVSQTMLVFPTDAALFIPYFAECAAGSPASVTQTVVTHGCRLICAIWTLPAVLNQKHQWTGLPPPASITPSSIIPSLLEKEQWPNIH